MTQQAQRSGVEIDVDELERLMTAGEVHVLDVREDWEWIRGHVAGATHIPLGQLPQRIFGLPKDKPLAVICEHGNRSLVAAHFLGARGFQGVVSVQGGTAAWARSKRPLER